MLDITEKTQSPSATAHVDASPATAVQLNLSPTSPEPTAEVTAAIRRLRVALEARFMALVLSDDNDARSRLLTQLTQSLPTEEYRILTVGVPPQATRTRMISLLTRSFNLDEPEAGRNTYSRLTAYDLLRRFEADTLRSYATGRRTLVIFDDAERLSPAGLHLVHSLSNITAEYDLAVPLILAAATSFAVRLRRPAWRALASRTGCVVRIDGKRPV